MKIRIYNNHGQVSVTKQYNNDEEEEYMCPALNDGEGIVIDVGVLVTCSGKMSRKSENILKNVYDWRQI